MKSLEVDGSVRAVTFSDYEFSKNSGVSSDAQVTGKQGMLSVNSTPSEDSSMFDGDREGEESFFVKSSAPCTVEGGSSVDPLSQGASDDLKPTAMTTGVVGSMSSSSGSPLSGVLASPSVSTSGSLTGYPKKRHVYLYTVDSPKRSVPPLALSSPYARRNISAIQREDVIRMISLFLDEAASQPCRPLLSFLGRSPVTPTLQEYRLRMCVNLLYFAKNYANLVVLVAILACLWHPCFVLLIAFTAAPHLMNRLFTRPRRVTAATRPSDVASGIVPTSVAAEPASLGMRMLRLTQFIASVFLLNYVGLVATCVFVLGFCVPIGAHAFFMPYSDAAYANYVATLQKRDLPVAAPRSPTCGLQSVDPTFEAAFSSCAVGVHSPVSPSLNSEHSFPIHGTD